MPSHCSCPSFPSLGDATGVVTDRLRGVRSRHRDVLDRCHIPLYCSDIRHANTHGSLRRGSLQLLLYEVRFVKICGCVSSQTYPLAQLFSYTRCGQNLLRHWADPSTWRWAAAV